MKTTLIYLGSESFTDNNTGEVKYIHHFGDDIVGGYGVPSRNQNLPLIGCL